MHPDDVPADTVTIEGIRFPLRSAKPGRCEHPAAVVSGVAYCPRSPNNVLLLEPPPDLGGVFPGWRRVGARPRWNFMDGAWRANDLSIQRVGQHRWWGVRDHVRLWRSEDGAYVIGQAHREDWQRWPRRHRVLELDGARDALGDAFAAPPGPTGGARSPEIRTTGSRPARTPQAAPHVSWFDTGATARGHDGRVLIMRCRSASD